MKKENKIFDAVSLRVTGLYTRFFQHPLYMAKRSLRDCKRTFFLKNLMLIPLVFITGLLQEANAQFKAQMILNARPTSLLADWANHPEILNYVVIYDGGAAGGSYVTKIAATFKDGAGNVIGTSDLNLVPDHVFTAGTTILQSKDVVLPQTIRFAGGVQKTLNASGRLPVGSYQLTLQILDAKTLQKLTEEITRPFTVISYQLPILIQPQNQAVLPAEQARVAITFRWTPLTPPPSQERISYMLQVFEIQEGQTPMQAFRANQPLLNQQVIGTTQFIWRPQLYLADSAQNRRFIWTVQTVDKDGAGFNNGVGDGRSEPFWFEVKSAAEILKERKE
ncbi:MAG TPA: hypothetical protein VG738_05380 [Chitinophagaceae bacterium]|nr:hypothetical protein [Chitinophagaceae bacterium]